MPVLVTDPFIRIRVPDGTTAVGLQDVLARSHDGTLIDFPGMRSDQRAPVVTALAVLSHLLRRYSASPLLTSQDWLDALQSQLGDALVLAGGSDKKPQFLQPVLVGLGDIKPFNITETDHLMAATRHVLKVADVATPEMALYALMASTWRHHGGVGHPAGARSRLLTVLVGDGVTIASEVASLACAYDMMTPNIVGTATRKPGRIRDHMLWAQPWKTEEPVAKLPFPFIDCRRIRLVPATGGLVSAVVVAENGTRVDTGTGNIDDPHVPIQVSTGGPYKLAVKRVWSYRVQHAAVAGSAEVSRPRILDLAPAYSSVRISGIGFDKATTKGAWEALYRIGRGKKMKLGQSEGNRLSELSSRALAVVHDASGSLYGPMLQPYPKRLYQKTSALYLTRAQSLLRDMLGHASLQTILDLLADPPDTEAEQRTLNAMAAAALREVWREATAGVRDPLPAARASLQLDYQMRDKFGEPLMTENASTPLGARIHAVLYDMDAHLSPANRASIRSAATELPLDAWLALAAAPPEDMERPDTRQVWETVVRALGGVRQGGPGIGAVLADTRYPEARVSALLRANGDALIGLIAEAVRWLVSHEVERCTLLSEFIDPKASSPAVQRLADAVANAVPAMA